MIVSRSCEVSESQLAISARVRPQPKQNPDFTSIEQTRVQGDLMSTIIFPSFQQDMGRRVH